MSNRIRKAALACLTASGNDESLVEELEELVREDGDSACQVVLQLLTSIDLAPEDAARCWNEVITNWRDLRCKLDREVNLRTAICDYFCTLHRSLENPKIVEIHVFEQTLKDTKYDKLTGLFNRNYFDEILKREVALANRHSTYLSILFLDIDDFKDINDTYGHDAGDGVLQHITKIMRHEKRKEDIACRYGGEELVLILPHTGNIEAMVLGQRILKVVEESPLKYSGNSIRMTLSGGLSTLPMDAEDPEGLLKNADMALYRAKGAGKNNISFASMDQRRFLRIKFSETIKVKELGFDDALNFTAESKDICMGGLLFKNDRAIPVGTQIQTCIPIIDQESPILIIGTVVRVEAVEDGNYDIGLAISFKEMDKITQNEISKYLTLSREQDVVEPEE